MVSSARKVGVPGLAYCLLNGRRFREPLDQITLTASAGSLPQRSEVCLGRCESASFNVLQKPRSRMKTKITNRFLAALALASAALVFAPTGARSQQEQT